MANTAQSKKRARQAETHRQRNTSYRAKFRTALKKILSAISAGNKDEASTALQSAVSIIDKTSNKGLIHKNKAARYKSRLNTRVQAM
ncbi:MAG: 30S ribosomal protein S20 [Woeseiaceae bacterium]